MMVQIDINDALEQYVGSLGRYQRLATFATSLAAAVSYMSLIDIMFLTSSPHFWYMYNGEELNSTLIQKRIDVCKLENGTPIDQFGTSRWQFDEAEFQASVVSRVNINVIPISAVLLAQYMTRSLQWILNTHALQRFQQYDSTIRYISCSSSQCGKHA